jgi:hypothetical protein
MTAQIPETLVMGGERMALCETPLGNYFALTGTAPRFRCEMTACWRGYCGTWEIKDSRLYLIDIHGFDDDNDSPITLESLFPGFPERVFAHWYSGTLRAPQGERLKYVHSGWASTYERDLLIEIEEGVVQEMRIRENRLEGEQGDRP